MKVLTRVTTSVLILLLSTVGLCYPQSTAVETHTEGIEYAVQGNFSEARLEFEKVLKIDPSFESARIALELIENVTDQKIKKETAIHHFKADGYIIERQWDEAIAECDKALEINHKFAMAYIDRGIASVGKREYGRAISDFNKAIEINPTLPGFYLSRGIVYSYKGEYDKAISDFDKTIDLNPKAAMGYYSRGLACQGKGEYDKAISDFDKAIGLNPKEAMFYRSRGAAWHYKGDYERAVADYTKASDMNRLYPAELTGKSDTLDDLDRAKKLTPEEGPKRIPMLGTIKVGIGNIRQMPTTRSLVIAKLRTGTQVTMVHQEGEWYAVKFRGGQLGWAHESIIVKSQ
ncbi:MAG: tetratricopeptide repeat protein [Deltaproteobacteria bacterium]|nr:tetratricopeptide repeat protein [Deltaproteobacteria bacterium]MBW2173278.1 tetratricopeptide repeat protein [Deltaproteobacteria bacterium]